MSRACTARGRQRGDGLEAGLADDPESQKREGHEPHDTSPAGRF